MGQYVGIDLHQRSTTIVRMAEDGEVLGTERIVSQPLQRAPEADLSLKVVRIVSLGSLRSRWSCGISRDDD